MSSEIVGVSTGELKRLANELQGSASAVGSLVQAVSDHPVGPGEVGANYPAEGAAVRAGLAALGERIAGWSGATAAAAESILVAVNRQSAADRPESGER
ncbi:hypothetical protein [Nocardia jiangsuensis]|uniref:Excreted virulence factor EspC (Type VII ESX diderm) n=1 Tax=Nocardia jiangsuensis TaxID=1691563 RepID=A0ABV8DXE0_9NOCA